MPPAITVTETSVSQASHGISTTAYLAATICLVWYCIVVLVCTIGYVQIWRHFSSPPPSATFNDGVAPAPDVTIIRPAKGLEPRMYDCLASTFRQDYPKNRLHIRFCVSDRNDPAVAVIKQLLSDFPTYDAQLLIEDEDDVLKDNGHKLGPNPKIRNMSRAYREAIGDVIWIIDCNVWVVRGVLGRMVATLEGHGGKRKYKFVHHLPIVVDIVGSTPRDESQALLNDGLDADMQIRTTSSASATMQRQVDRTALSIGGGRLEEMFMATAHSKFYTAINTVAIAPCIVGKSTMFRRSHLNSVTDNIGVDFFSENICEDHLIGDQLWKNAMPEERRGEKMGKHGMCLGDFAFQPMANMSVGEYWSRRLRWLRVRKFTVTLATMVEPGIEPFLCSLHGAFAVTTLPFFRDRLGVPQTWTAMATFWLLSVSIWCLVDWTQYSKLHSGSAIQMDEYTPSFARPPKSKSRRPFSEWIFAWIGRESLAFPIWFWACWGGTQVEWRGKKFRVGLDTKVHEIGTDTTPAQVNGHAGSPDKARVD